MSYFSCPEPQEAAENCPETVEMVLIPRTSDIGGFDVQRVLPSRQRRMVGPFIFWDQMGPGEFLTGQGVDVRPHPHIGLSTLTYLFDGSLMHRDSLGSAQLITPGDVNLMTAGRGIVHSERTTPEVRRHPHKLFGIQCWLALPGNMQEIVPTFTHHGKNKLPLLDDRRSRIRLVAGQMQGVVSPVQTASETLFADALLQAGARVKVPAEIEERALYIVKGKIEVSGVQYPAGQMLVLKPGALVEFMALSTARVMIIGGEPMDGSRYIWWNFVSNSKDRLEQAKNDWKHGHFPKVSGDEEEFIPLP